MTRRRDRHKGRSEGGTFVAIPHAVLNSPNYLALSMHARGLLFDMAVQYRGKNNGDLCAAWTLMKRRGWKSKETLGRALKELRDYGFILLTRQGGRNLCSLYALTWRPIDHCGGKLDEPSTVTAPGTWKEPRAVKAA